MLHLQWLFYYYIIFIISFLFDNLQKHLSSVVGWGNMNIYLCAFLCWGNFGQFATFYKFVFPS